MECIDSFLKGDLIGGSGVGWEWKYVGQNVRAAKIGQGMLDKLKVKEKGWQDWLVQYNLWDKGMDEDAIYMRYAKFFVS